MPLTRGFMSLAFICIVFLQFAFSDPLLPSRNKRHVDSKFTSEYSRVRGSAAIRKYINAALAGKRDVEEFDLREEKAINAGPEANSQGKGYPGLSDSSRSELRSEEKGLDEQDLIDSQLCQAILYLIRKANRSQQTRITQDY
uniref:Glucagon / GIP / secretin / VIP family domain-containing protein n=1 Tax=Leptobrachium leishanense TaxID=445787 RepID=A0A8C5QH20_9ANUR